MQLIKKSTLRQFFSGFIFVSLLSVCYSLSATELPADWQTWSKPQTPLTKIGALPDCSADVSALPAIYQETVATYCAVREGGPGKVSVLVRPSEEQKYARRQGGFAPGINMLLHLEDMKLLFATEYTSSGPQYHVFKETGEEIRLDQPGHPLNPQACMTCHTGYSSYCVEGQCGIKQ
jgi:hypothetical protein